MRCADARVRDRQTGALLPRLSKWEQALHHLFSLSLSFIARGPRPAAHRSPPHPYPTMQAALLGSSVSLGGARLAIPARATSRAGAFSLF